MSGCSNAVKDYIERYKREVRNDGLLDPHDLAGWAYQNGLHKPNVKTIIDIIAADIAQAFREEYARIPHRGATPTTTEAGYDENGGQITGSPGLVMTRYFVPLKDENRAGRFVVFLLYVLGFAVLGVPTAEVFVRVLLSLTG
jgi:hypothetical protein